MANLEFDGISADIESVRRRARHSTHVQRAQVMLLAACLSTLGVVAVAGTLLTRIF
ncbi:hypothetical protein [Devosia rhizoryzae]|uniref:Uncharacterized protein n=1 Tax=Devosia rhizoryzae TaxID=2774137 RepID=A0ABX7C3B7_9HYPH|nr:hypothetical protein [Devosia rhizoryzae]QQR38278.1 hypothetical protein JI748_10835 [Devosia rhizoryzae]